MCADPASNTLSSQQHSQHTQHIINVLKIY